MFLLLRLSRPVGGTGGIHSTVEGQVDLPTWLTWSYCRCDDHLTTSELVLQLVQFKRSDWDGASACSTQNVRSFVACKDNIFLRFFLFFWNWHFEHRAKSHWKSQTWRLPSLAIWKETSDIAHWRWSEKGSKLMTLWWSFDPFDPLLFCCFFFLL